MNSFGRHDQRRRGGVLFAKASSIAREPDFSSLIKKKYLAPCSREVQWRILTHRN